MKSQAILLTTIAIFRVIEPTPAANFTVTTTNNSGPNSLRAILTTANRAAGPHTITFGNTGNFASGGTINLVSPLPEITQSTTISGWRDGGSTNNAIRVAGSSFVFGAGTTNSLAQLNIGGSVTNGHNLSITGCIITNGGVYSTGVLQMISSVLSSSPSAGIWNSGSATLNGVTVWGCNGGGIHNEGAMAIMSSSVCSNTAPTDGGGIYSDKVINLTECRIVGNQAMTGFGGGFLNMGTANLRQTTIWGNAARGGGGGGIYNKGKLIALDSLIAENQARGQNAPTNGNANGGGGGGLGGGVFCEAGQLSLTNCTIQGNIALGGDGGTGVSGYWLPGGQGAGTSGGNGGAATWGTGQDGGFGSGGGGGGGGSAPGSGNGSGGGQGGRGGFGGGGGGGGNGYGGWGAGTPGSAGLWGGPGYSVATLGKGGGGGAVGSGVFVVAGTVQAVNCTLVQNRAIGGFPNGKGAAAFYNYGGTASILNTIVASNLSTTSDPGDVYGVFFSQGHNFIESSGGSSGWDAVSDYLDAVPLSLGPLQYNGGSTLTCALLQGSLRLRRFDGERIGHLN